MSTPAKIIINADDFGLNSAVNEAVLASAESGILSSATVMANMPGFFEATRGALSYPRLGVGVHLNLIGPVLNSQAHGPAGLRRRPGPLSSFAAPTTMHLRRWMRSSIFIGLPPV